MRRAIFLSAPVQSSASRGVSLARSAVLAMVDYLPPWSGGRWDMMQAAIASSADLPSVPTAYPTATSTATNTRPPLPTATATDPSTPEPVPTMSTAAGLAFAPYCVRRADMRH